MDIKKTFHPLFLKILAGYIPLVILLGVVTGKVWEEHRIAGELENSERLLREKRIQVYHTFGKLLELSFFDSFFYRMDKEQYKVYRAKTTEAITALEELRTCSTDMLQTARIDTVCLLLLEKQRQIPVMMGLQDDFARLDSLAEVRIHTIARQTEQLPEKPVKKPGLFARLFPKKDRQSEPVKRKNPEKDEQQAPGGKLSSMLHSLRREFNTQSEEHKQRLELYADSLYARDIKLNAQFSQLLYYLEQTALQMEEEVQQMAEVREKSFRQIAYLSVGALLLSIILYYFIGRDIMRRRAVRLQLEELNSKNERLLKTRKKMMMAVSHDLRTPLAAITGYAELIAGERQEEKRIRYSEAIRQSTGWMSGLLDSLLKLYRLDASKEQPDNHPFRIKTLTEILKANFSLPAAKKQIAFTSEYNGGDVVVTGDREKILQITGNLLSNAIKFTDAGEVGLHLHYSNNQLTIEVQDTGSGMSESHIEQVFQPFERLCNAETQEGFGLGLSITSALVKLLNGKIDVKSEQGKGSLFTVHLPLSVTDEENPLPEADRAYALPANLSILVIDDDPMLLTMTLDMLSRNGISCRGCQNVHELTEQLRIHTYDLLITDIKMPEMSGYQLLELLRNSNIGLSQTIPVLAATACANRKREDFILAGFAGCLHKPFSQAELLSVVQDCIKQEQISRIPRQADFSVLLSGEQNCKKMLGLLIHETGRNMTILEKSIKDADLTTIFFVIHHLLPLWELIRVDGTLKFLQHLPDVSSDEMNKEIEQAVRDVIEQGNAIIRQAQIKTKQIKQL
jgi:signal transduction histidine kinase/DNA-binding response OmpR family regulator